jgi:hypothetical protein
MSLVIPPLPLPLTQQPLAPKAEVVHMAQLQPMATQTQRALAGPSRGRGGEGGKSQEKRSKAEGPDDRAREATQVQRGHRRGGVTIDV